MTRHSLIKRSVKSLLKLRRKSETTNTTLDKEYGSWNEYYGYGLVDANSAVQMTLARKEINQIANIMTTTKRIFLIVACLISLLSTVSADEEKTIPPAPQYYGTNLIDPTLYIPQGGLLYDNVSFVFDDTVAFDKNTRAFLVQDGVVIGSTRPYLTYSGFEDVTYHMTALNCTFDFLRLPVGNYAVVIPAGTVWWKSAPALKNDIIELPICIHDYLHVLQTTPENGDTIKTLQKFSILFHCYATEKSNPCVTLYEGDNVIETSPMQVINDWGIYDTAEAEFGKTLHFKKGTKYSFVVAEDAFQSRNLSYNLSNKEIRVDFVGGE